MRDLDDRRDLYEDFLDWLAEEIQPTEEIQMDRYYDYKGRFLKDVDCITDEEYEEFMEKVKEHELVVITKKCWEKCKEKIKEEVRKDDDF